jgi:uncharacterized RDD family membrane protein YckC
MKNLHPLLLCAALALLGGGVIPAHAQSMTWADHDDSQIVDIGHDARLPAGETAEDVVSIFGNAIADGDVSDSAVAVLGDVTVNGTVGNSAVAVLGNVYINNKVRGQVVAVLGNVTLGPQAVVEGQVVEILGTLQKSPGAVIQGGSVHILSGIFSNIEGLHAWIERCLLYGRPLAPTLAVGWAWGFALGALAIYLLLAAVFRDGMQRCVQTLESHPGESVLTALIVTLLIPVVLLSLVFTVVGIGVIPLFWIALICAGIFGRAVALAWLGGRCIRFKHAGTVTGVPPVLDVLVGGILVLLLYMIPVLGFIVYLLVGIVGFGAVAYTILLGMRSRRAVAAGAEPHLAAAAASAATAGVPPPSSGGGDDGGEAAATAPGATAAPPAASELLSATTYPRAGFWIRMVALLIDLILVGVALNLLHPIVRGTLIVLAIYGAIMWKMKGTTIGGIVCDLKVVRVDGRPLDWWTAIVRALGCFLSLVVAGLGFIWIAFDREHQAWHDKIAGTIVVRVPKGVGLV